MAIKVREAMTPGVRWVAPTDSVNTAATMMRGNDVGSLPIVDDGQLVGIITDRDIVMRAVALGAATDRLTVGVISSREVLTARPDQDLADAAQVMARGQVRRPTSLWLRTRSRPARCSRRSPSHLRPHVLDPARIPDGHAFTAVMGRSPGATLSPVKG